MILSFLFSLPKRTSLATLLERVAAADMDALAELYSRVEGNIFAFALKRLRHRDDAEDLVHEVMLVVWRRASTFRRQSDPKTWILGIAHHKIVDRLRRSARQADEPASKERIDPAGTPFDTASAQDRLRIVKQVLSTLSDEHNQVVHLAFYEDCSYPEIASILDIPVGTVKTRMFHAKKILRKRLGAHVAEGERP